MARCAIISFRLGGTDGVSVAADSWRRCLEDLGWEVTTVAGSGPVDRLVAGLEIGATTAPDPRILARSLADADLVLAENILTIPLSPAASRAVAAELRGRPAICHHHDPPWQRKRFAHITELPPDDPAWVHVTINQLTRQQLAARGIEATTVYNAVDQPAVPGERQRTRQALGVADGVPLVVHPVRAIERKSIPAAIALTEAIGGIYWLTGAAEEGYGPRLATILGDARCPVIHSRVGPGRTVATMADLYAAADVVAFPSTWEGFGIPPLEAALHRRPAAVGHYPVAKELRRLGFQWLDPADPGAIKAAVTEPDGAALTANHHLAMTRFSRTELRERVNRVVREAGS